MRSPSVFFFSPNNPRVSGPSLQSLVRAYLAPKPRRKQPPWATTIKIKKQFPQFDKWIHQWQKNEKNKQHMQKNIPGASRYYNKNHGKIIENMNLQQLQETSKLINRSLEGVVPLGWLWANVVRILVHLGHCGFGLRIENCGLGGIPLSQCSYGPMNGCKRMFFFQCSYKNYNPQTSYSMFEGSLEVKLPTMWADEKQESEKRRRKKIKKRKSQ